MADVYKGLTVKLGADTTNLSRGLANVNSQINATSRGLAAVNKALKLSPGNTQLLASQQALLGNKIAETTQKLEIFKTAQSEMQGKMGPMTAEEQAAYARIQASIATCESQLVGYNAQLTESTALQSAQESAAYRAGTAIETFGTKMAGANAIMVTTGAALEKYVTVPLAAAAAVSVKSSFDYESAVAKMATIMDTSQVSVSDMSKAVMEASQEYGVGAADIADSIYSIISATGDTAGAMDVERAALELSKAGFTDNASAVSILTTAMNAYHMSASDTTAINDSLLMTQNLGVTTVAQLSENMGVAIATASGYGVSLNNLEAGYVALTKSGINTAESTTYLSGMITELGDSGSQVSQILQSQTGQTFGELMSSGMSLADVLKILYDTTGDNSEAFMNLFGNVRAAKAANAIANQGFEQTNDWLNQISNSAGATDTAFQIIEDTGATALEKMKTSAQDAAIAVGEDLAPYVTAAADAVKTLADDFANMDDNTKHHVETLALWAAAAGPVLSITGKVGGGLTTLGTTMKGMSVLMQEAKTNGVSAFGQIALNEQAAATGAKIETAATKEVTAATKVLNTVSSIGKAAVAGLAIAGVAVLATETVKYVQKQMDMNKSIEGMASAADRATASVSDMAGGIKNITDNTEPAKMSLGDLRDALDDAAQSRLTLEDAMNGRSGETEASIGLLETYRQTIDKYANQSGLTAQQQAELKAAVDGVNEACGTQYSVVDSANGKIQDETGTILGNTDAIDGNIDAIERKLQVEALEEDYKDVYKQQYQDQQNLAAAQDAMTTAQDNYNAAVARGEDPSAYAAGINIAKKSLDDAQSAVDADAESLDKLTTAMGDASSGLPIIKSQLEGFANTSPEVQSAFDSMGISTDDFAQKLADAGVSSEQMQGISQDAFQNMVANCGGNLDILMSEIQMYNQQPIVDKDGNVTAETTSLVDAQGQIYTWNGSTLIDQNGNAAVEDTSLLDAQGNVVTWNGTGLDYKSANADVNSQSVINAKDNINNYNDTNPEDKHATTWIDIITNVINGNAAGGYVENAAGGFRLNAIGGYRMHANGAIATRAVPLDIVGENGAEAIVPLTNRKYAQPFAKIIAEQMGNNAPVYNISIDGLTYNDDAQIGAATMNLISTLKRKAAM